MKPGTVVPEGEGPLSSPMSVRIPERLLERIEKCAAQTKNTRTDTMLWLWRWALDQYEANADVGAKKKGTA